MKPLRQFLRRVWWSITGRRAVRLYLTPFASQALIPRHSAASIGIPLTARKERLRLLLNLNPGGSPPNYCECWLDTGAYLTVIPERFWQPVASSIMWLAAPPGEILPSWLTAFGLGGRHYACKVGLLRVQMADGEGRSLPPDDIIALFAEDGLVNSSIPAILLGLDGRVFTRRRLELLSDDDGGWLSLR